MGWIEAEEEDIPELESFRQMGHDGSKARGAEGGTLRLVEGYAWERPLSGE